MAGSNGFCFFAATSIKVNRDVMLSAKLHHDSDRVSASASYGLISIQSELAERKEGSEVPFLVASFSLYMYV